MSIIENIQNKPHSYKVRLMWIIIIAVAFILVVSWILMSRISNNVGTASDFISSQVKDIRQNGKQMYEENK